MNQSIMRSVDHASNSFLAPPTATKIEEPARKANMSDKPKIDYSNMKKVKCLFDFTKTDPDSLGLTKGQIVYIENDEDPEWWIAIDPKTEERGAIPKCFVHPYDENLEKEEVDHLENFSTDPVSFSPKFKDQKPNKDCN
ncbi:Arf-GAP with SH3 domain, ANK repeat and PH domain-containing protein 2 [Thelohanellus kitauei]|uniref:Arf-GAP with SH3 domain, ANK repeat and PH domain-containing protein 2 n=1 Tax=Thelohanellus kitauei TaxID=669202 RepID=A0A0C2J0K8_THEKT|nr:Arf-GAP with SH3 domain, ANK repeat and PH domain-containing protein 2 [Thelohanellus kitauei]